MDDKRERQSDPGSRFLLFDKLRAVGLAVIGLACLCIGLLLFFDGIKAFGVLAALVGVGVMASSLRHVLVTHEGVRLRYVWRSVSIAWDEVVAFDRRMVPNWFGERLNRPVVILNDGTCRPIPGADQVSLLSNPRLRLRVVDQLELLRREHQGRG